MPKVASYNHKMEYIRFNIILYGNHWDSTKLNETIRPCYTMIMSWLNKHDDTIDEENTSSPSLELTDSQPRAIILLSYKYN